MIKNKITILAIFILFFLIIIGVYKYDLKIVKEYPEPSQMDTSSFIDIQTSYKSYGVKDDVLGMKIIITNLTNGGNGNHDYPITINWDLKSFKQLKNSELFCSKDYVSTLIPLVRKQLVKDFSNSPHVLVKPIPKDMVDWINSGTENKQENWENFLISSNGLIVVFPPYQVASGAEGTVHVLIPYSDIPRLLCLPSSI